MHSHLTLSPNKTHSYARSLVDEVVRVHGHQILKMGLFNGTFVLLGTSTASIQLITQTQTITHYQATRIQATFC
jgi:hypothetical protein